MNTSSSHPGRHMVDGTFRIFLAEALILPTGLVTFIFLTRRLGPEGYGMYTLAAMLVALIEWGISSTFSRATVKFVSEAANWRSVGTVVVRIYLTVSVGAALILFVLATPIASLLNEPVLVNYLRLFALDIPLFGLAHAKRDVLIGIGGFRKRALMSAGRWLTKLMLIVLLVELGLSVPGAILGSIGASLVELVIGRFYVRLSPFRSSTFPARRLFSYSIPLALFALSIGLYSKLDLLMLKLLGGTIDQAGIYGAAQNLSIVPGIFSLSFSPLLLSTLSRMLRDGNGHLAREMGRNAIRSVIWLLPFAGMTAGAAQEIVGLILGPLFMSTAPLLALLIFASLALVMISVATAILTAAGKPGLTFALTGPIVPLAIIGHLLLIPRLGAIGASLITTLFASLSAFAAVLAIYRIWNVLPPLATVMRSILICGIAFTLANLWPAPGFLLILKLSVIVIVIALAFLVMGEFSTSEIAFVRSIFRRRTVTDKS